MYEYSFTVSLVKDVGNELRTMHLAGNCKQAYKYVLQLLCYCISLFRLCIVILLPGNSFIADFKSARGKIRLIPIVVLEANKLPIINPYRHLRMDNRRRPSNRSLLIETSKTINQIDRNKPNSEAVSLSRNNHQLVPDDAGSRYIWKCRLNRLDAPPISINRLHIHTYDPLTR